MDDHSVNGRSLKQAAEVIHDSLSSHYAVVDKSLLSEPWMSSREREHDAVERHAPQQQAEGRYDTANIEHNGRTNGRIGERTPAHSYG